MCMFIPDILKNKKTSLSFEFFPPKNLDLESVLFETIESLKGEGADFASVTFGAGGSNAGKTLEWINRIKSLCGIETMMHLTCVGFNKAQLNDTLTELKLSGVHNILALRGDMPANGSIDRSKMDFAHASDLVKYLADDGDFSIGVAGYPECHPESLSEKDDMAMLKVKVDAGADFIITQLFFDNDCFYRFRDNALKSGIELPLVAGIMPIVSAAQVIRFTQVCKAGLPSQLLNKIEGKPDDYVINIGIDYAAKQCEELIKNGVNGVHFYTLNRSVATKRVLDRIKQFLS